VDFSTSTRLQTLALRLGKPSVAKSRNGSARVRDPRMPSHCSCPRLKASRGGLFTRSTIHAFLLRVTTHDVFAQPRSCFCTERIMLCTRQKCCRWNFGFAVCKVSMNHRSQLIAPCDCSCSRNSFPKCVNFFLCRAHVGPRSVSVSSQSC
jgi:hypothetical protein